MRYGVPVTDVIRQRFSCRTYLDAPIAEETRQALEAYLDQAESGPFGAPVRLELVAAGEEDRSALRGLGTYGFIRGATGFILGAVGPGRKNMEDFGYRMEDAILYATALDLGTCWLGGTFRRSRFAERLAMAEGEIMPCVTAVGHISERRSLVDRVIRRQARGERRYPWERLFFEGRFSKPLVPERAGAYAGALEMVRLGPSASNKQPWRVVKADGAWHFYLQRTPGYLQGAGGAFVEGDLQRVDLGIALCHFERTAREAGLGGAWTVDGPAMELPGVLLEYTASWIEG
ncbi:MAG: nitroreductase family protein [Anaerolineae bacterium]